MLRNRYTSKLSRPHALLPLLLPLQGPAFYLLETFAQTQLSCNVASATGGREGQGSLEQKKHGYR